MNKGFTLIELIVVIALIAGLSALAIPIYSSFQIEVQFDNTTAEITQTLRRAQALTLAGEQDKVWGVTFTSSSYSLYANGDASFDELETIPATLTLSGLSTVEFSRLNGGTADTGSITVTASSIGKIKTISVNSEGRVE